MSDTTQTPQTSTSGEEKPRREFFRRAALATVIAGVTAGIGITALAEGGAHWRWHRGGFLGASLDPAMLDERLRQLEQSCHRSSRNR